MKLVSFYKKSNCYLWCKSSHLPSHTQSYLTKEQRLMCSEAEVQCSSTQGSKPFTGAELRSLVSQHEKSNPVNFLSPPPECLKLSSTLPGSLSTPLFSIPPPQCLGGPYALRPQTTLTSLHLDCFALEKSFRSFTKSSFKKAQLERAVYLSTPF